MSSPTTRLKKESEPLVPALLGTGNVEMGTHARRHRMLSSGMSAQATAGVPQATYPLGAAASSIELLI